jgi:hypothetical protein
MTLTGIDQSWIADIIYIRLDMEFVYLAVLLDAFSRRVIGWALDRHLEDDLAIAALELAFRCRTPYTAQNTNVGLVPARHKWRSVSPLHSCCRRKNPLGESKT